MSPAKNQLHLLWRAGFGPDLKSYENFSAKSPAEIFDKMLLSSSTQPEMLKVFSPDSGEFRDVVREGLKGGITTQQRAAFRQKNREGFKELNLLWLDQMVNSDAQLREKMALFWHGHFACRVNNILYQQELLHIIRENALGDFRTLLTAVSRSAAMLAFLNNQQNRKKKPNENFARELMELFTMGRGNYSEIDVKESARAFTGWGFDLQGKFIFRPALHDGGEKIFLGEKGNFTGDDIIRVILEQKKTSFYISKKIASFFAGTELPERIIQPLAEIFYKSKYDIAVLLKSIFTSSWFYEENYSGNRIKSPVEWLVGIRRTLPFSGDQNNWQLIMEKLLGQVLFFPPNVAGWPGGINWIDSSTLMYRLRFPVLLNGGSAELGRPKEDDDVQMGRMEDDSASKSADTGLNKKISLSVNWSEYALQFESVPRNKLMEQIRSAILLTDNQKTDILEKYTDAGSRENYIRTLTIRLMSTPDYQLC